MTCRHRNCFDAVVMRLCSYVGRFGARVRHKASFAYGWALLLLLPVVSCGKDEARASHLGGGGFSGEAGQSGGGVGGKGDAAGGAGEGGAPVGDRVICDGSEGLRFAAAMPWGGEVEFATGLLYELGVLYLFVNGRCEYVTWDKDPEVTGVSTWAPVRHGTLDEATARELAEAFSYARWPDWEGVYAADPGSFDTPWLVLFDGEHQVVCQTPCTQSAPDIQRAAADLSLGWIKRLYSEGEDLDGPMRLRLFEAERDIGLAPLDWPLSHPPDEYVSPIDPLCASGPNPGCPTDIYGPAYVIDDPADLAALRALRPVLAARVSASAPAVAAHEDPDRSYRYVFRDITPFEDEDGSVPGLW